MISLKDYMKDQGLDPAEVLSSDVKSESRARTGWSPLYPPSYFASQYPTNYVIPKKATALLNAKQMKRA